MSYRGEVRNGVVVMEPGASLREGTLVRIEPIEPESTQMDRLTKTGSRGAESLSPTTLSDEEARALDEGLESGVAKPKIRTTNLPSYES